MQQQMDYQQIVDAYNGKLLPFFTEMVAQTNELGSKSLISILQDYKGSQYETSVVALKMLNEVYSAKLVAEEDSGAATPYLAIMIGAIVAAITIEPLKPVKQIGGFLITFDDNSVVDYSHYSKVISTGHGMYGELLQCLNTDATAIEKCLRGITTKIAFASMLKALTYIGIDELVEECTI